MADKIVVVGVNFAPETRQLHHCIEHISYPITLVRRISYLAKPKLFQTLCLTCVWTNTTAGVRAVNVQEYRGNPLALVGTHLTEERHRQQRTKCRNEVRRHGTLQIFEARDDKRIVVHII